MVDDLQSSTTYSFNILAFNTKGESDYTTDIVQKSTTAQPESPDTGTDTGTGQTNTDSGSDSTSRSGQLLIIISSVGGALLLCNLGLLYCYWSRRRADDSMSRSSILEMYFSSTSSQDREVEYDSESESEVEMEGRDRVRRWRYGPPSPPPWTHYS